MSLNIHTAKAYVDPFSASSIRERLLKSPSNAKVEAKPSEPFQTGEDHWVSSVLPNSYKSLAGTSMATPHAPGAVGSWMQENDRKTSVERPFQEAAQQLKVLGETDKNLSGQEGVVKVSNLELTQGLENLGTRVSGQMRFDPESGEVLSLDLHKADDKDTALNYHKQANPPSGDVYRFSASHGLRSEEVFSMKTRNADGGINVTKFQRDLDSGSTSYLTSDDYNMSGPVSSKPGPDVMTRL